MPSHQGRRRPVPCQRITPETEPVDPTRLQPHLLPRTAASESAVSCRVPRRINPAVPGRRLLPFPTAFIILILQDRPRRQVCRRHHHPPLVIIPRTLRILRRRGRITNPSFIIRLILLTQLPPDIPFSKSKFPCAQWRLHSTLINIVGARFLYKISVTRSFSSRSAQRYG